MPPELEIAAEEILIPPQLAAPIEGRLAPSPYNFEFTGEDALRLTVHNSQTGVRVAVHWRLANRNGEIVANTHTLAPTSDRVATSSEFTIGEGYLLNATVFASAGAPRRGQTFTRLQVIRGRGAASVVLGTVVQGYVTGNQDRAWPGSPLEGSLHGDGYERAIGGTDPVAGEEVLETVPTGARWELISLAVEFTTNANVANRYPEFSCNSGGLRVAHMATNVAIPASTGVLLTWCQGLPVVSRGAPDRLQGPLPPGIVFLAGSVFNTSTQNKQAGDNYGAPLYLVREWLEAQ